MLLIEINVYIVHKVVYAHWMFKKKKKVQKGHTDKILIYYFEGHHKEK